MRKILLFITLLTLSISLYGCSKTVNIEGVYGLKTSGTETIEELSDDYELICLNSDGTFLVQTYIYDRSGDNNIFTGELHTDMEGEYLVKGNKVEIEFFLFDQEYNMILEYDSNTLTHTYETDGSQKEKTDIYEKLDLTNLVILDGNYELNTSRSTTDPDYFDDSTYSQVTIDNTQIQFFNDTSTQTAFGDIILGTTCAAFINKDYFQLFDFIMIKSTEYGVDIFFYYHSDIKSILSYDKID